MKENICKSDKGLIYKIYKEHIQLNKKINNLILEEWAKDINRLSCKENLQMARK